MFYLLLILGLACMAAGTFAIGFAVPSHDTPLGSALLVVGSVAFTGGLIAVGLAATVAELRHVIAALKARMPVVPRPLRPADRKDGGEKRPGPPRIPMPARSSPDAQQAQPMASMPAMAPMAPPPALPEPPVAAMPDIDPAPLRKPGPEWLRRAIAEIETAPNPGDASPGDDYYRDDLRPIPEVRPMPDMRPPLELRPRMNAPPLVTPPEPAPEPPLQPPPQRQAAPASQRNIFDVVWPSERNRASGEGSPQRQPDFSREPLRPPEPRGAQLAQPLPPIGTSAPQQPEERPPAILKSGVIDEMAYTLFADGSIEANMPDGTMRFASIEELRQHLEKHDS
jgi:hypothetical protein